MKLSWLYPILPMLAASASDGFAQCANGSPPPCISRAAATAPASRERARRFMFLPFRNVTRRAEHDWLVSGSPLMLGQALGQFRDLHVVPEERLEAAKRRLRIPTDSSPDATQLRRLAEETGGWTAVTGNIFATGQRLRITLQAMDVPTSRVVARAEREVEANGDLRDAFDALSVRLLEPAGVPATGVGLAALTTRSVDAYRAYVRGIDFYHRSEYRNAFDAFSEAVRLDSTFALGWSNLAFMTVSTRGFQEMLNPASMVYRAIDRAARHSQQLRPEQAALTRAMQAFSRARITEARRITDSLVTADPRNVNALELLASLYGIGSFLSQSTSPSVMAADVNRGVRIARQVLDLDPSRRMTYSFPAMTYGVAAGVFWGHTWSDPREFSALPFLLMAVSAKPAAAYVPIFRDSIVFVPLDSFKALPDAEQQRLRRPGAERAMQWVDEWLAVGPEDAEAHLWASRIADLQTDYPRALREFEIADSIGIQSGIENGPGRRLSLLVLTGDYGRAGAFADSLLAAGAMNAWPFLSAVDRRWTYGVAALLLSRRWERAAALAGLINTRRKLEQPCEALAHELRLVDTPVAEPVRLAVMDTVSAHIAEVRASPALAPCVQMLTTRLVR